MTSSNPIRVGLYGTNPHQVQEELENHPHAIWVAAAEIDTLPKGVHRYENLEALLEDPEIDLISFCAPRIADQGEFIIRALNAGKHVYAEKPCCLDEATLDRIIETSRITGRRFHEMAGTAFEQPYVTIRNIVQAGTLGEVVQVMSQKSYPWTDWRPKDEAIDGGLACQVGVHNLRFAEHVAGMRISGIDIRETSLGNAHEGSDCQRAVSFLMTFENGGNGTAIANYLCPQSWSGWGYDILRIFGTKGFVEVLDHGRLGQIVLEGIEPRSLDFAEPVVNFFAMMLEEIRTGSAVIPMTLEEELSPTRWVLRAKRTMRNTQVG
jgi:predicted dehydrogenase